MQAYRSSTWRSATLRERIPPPTGVVSGPLMATRCVRMASSVASGSQVPTCLKAFSPASTSSQPICRLAPDTFRTAACWLFAGPGGATARALLACRHHATHHAAGGHHTVPSDGPCFCDEMTGGSDLALSVAVAEPPPTSPAIATPEQMLLYPSLFP